MSNAILSNITRFRFLMDIHIDDLFYVHHTPARRYLYICRFRLQIYIYHVFCAYYCISTVNTYIHDMENVHILVPSSVRVGEQFCVIEAINIHH